MVEHPPGGAMRGIGDLPTLPIFVKLGNRTAVLAGGSQPAVWKAELLAAAGAIVHVFDANPCAAMTALAVAMTGRVRLVDRNWTAPDLEGAALAIGALTGAEAESFRRAAVDAGVPVNIVDVPHLCDFQFGTIVDRGPLVIAISTDGAAPVFGQALRTRIEALLPQDIEAWAQAAKDWRPALQAQALSFAARRRFWEKFADLALKRGRPPNEQDREACFKASHDATVKGLGAIDLVGLGPGQRDRLTLEAVRALQGSDAIVFGVGINPALMGLARREAVRIPEAATDADTARMIEGLVESGQRVAWAGLGDPSCALCWKGRRAALTMRPRAVVAGLRCDACPETVTGGGFSDRPS